MTDMAASYVCGTAYAPLLGETIGQSLDLAVQRWGDREALVSPSHDVRWSWREFSARVDALAAHRQQHDFCFTEWAAAPGGSFEAGTRSTLSSRA